MTQEQKPLNRFEIFASDHAPRIFVVVALLIVLGAGAVLWVFQRQGDTQRQVDVLKPQVTKIVRAAKVCSLDAARKSQESRDCALRLRVALVNCRQYPRCRAALLAILTYPPPARSTSTTSPSSTTATTTAPAEKGGATQQPSDNGHQQPGPGKGPQGGNGGNGGDDQGDGQSAAPAPSPGASGGEGGSGAGQGQESPGNGAQGSQDDSSSSGADVEVCALERTCVGVEVGVDPKGLLP
jgi:hypothetical protein